MQCACGVLNALNTKFCKGCGKAADEISKEKPSTTNCPSCTAPLKVGSIFCNKCGNKYMQPSNSTAYDEAKVEPDENSVNDCQLCINAIKSKAKFCVACGKGTNLDKSNEMEVKNSIPAAIASPKEYNLPLNERRFKDINTYRNKIVAGTAAAVLLATACFYALRFNEDNKTLAVVAPSVKPTITTIKPITPANTVAIATPQSESADAAHALKSSALAEPIESDFIGKMTKNGGLFISPNYLLTFDHQSNFAVLKADKGYPERSVLMAVANKDGLITDAKILKENDQHIINGKDGCVLNGKPYPGVYAVATVNSLSAPSEIWKINNDGKLIAQDIPGIKCGVYEINDNDDETEYTGYNVNHNQIKSVDIPVKTNIINKHAQHLPVAVKKEVKTTEVSKAVIAPVAVKPEKIQAPTNSVEAKSNQDDSFSSLLNKLGDTVKNGTKEHICSSSERAMNQCQ